MSSFPYENHTNPYQPYSYNHHLLDPTIIFDMSGTIFYHNSEIINFLNCSEEILKEKNIKNILPDFELKNLAPQFKNEPNQKYSCIQKTFSNISIRIMIHSFTYLDSLYFCTQFKRSFFRVLIVDDDKVCQAILQRYLKNFEFESIKAENAFEALEKLTSPKKGDSIDIVVTDYMMPKMNGLEEVKEFRKKTDAKTPFFLCTSEKLTRMFKDRCKKKHRFQKVLPKPVNREKLLKALESTNFPIKKR